jgi:hypothetical protein
MPTDPPPPRRNKHLARWFLVFAIAVFGWGAWRLHAYRTALAQAEALEWEVQYTDPVETIRRNWKSAFHKDTWLEGVTDIVITESESFEQNLTIVHRLNPIGLRIRDASTLRDLTSLKPLTRLQTFITFDCPGLTDLSALKHHPGMKNLMLNGCTKITNVDILKDLPALEFLSLDGCTGLTNLDVLKNLPALETLELNKCTGLKKLDAIKSISTLKELSINECTGLKPENIDALQTALPDLRITGP